MTPKGVFDRRLARSLGLAGVSGLAMVATARALSALSPFLVAPIAVIAYAFTLWITGGIEPNQIAAVREIVRRKLLRGARASSVSP
jgi:hypothetical protein